MNEIPSIYYGIHPSPFGQCLIGITDQAICHLSFMDTVNEREALRRLREIEPNATFKRKESQTRPYFKAAFEPKRSKHRLDLVVTGTDFQLKVWETLLKIPKGKVSNYAQVARKAGFPKAVRAVGTACGKNPIGFLIPCHRVLASDGKLGGYHWGLQRKKAILAWEAAG